YLKRVEEFRIILDDIKDKLEGLRDLVEREEDHPILVGEIKDKIRHFELSLCLLAPELQYEAVCKAREHFQGRKMEMNRFRGMHVPMQIDFYNI
ncbi:MAG: hypothetical protein AAB348_03560, partial [Patescibacteria group bacterium]